MADTTKMQERPAQSTSSSLGVGLIAVILCVLIVVGAWIFFGIAKVQAQEQGTVSVKQSIMDSAKQCFAIEGAYPSSLEYLEENYGLAVNHDAYVIYYDAFAANLPPSVVVSVK